MEVPTSNLNIRPTIQCLKNPLPKSSTDSESKNTLPEKFRTTNPPYSKKIKDADITGFQTLNISGSAQFSEGELKAIIKELQPLSKFIIVDLRGDCHGYFNGNAISWSPKKDELSDNSGLTYSEIISKEKDFLLQKSCKSNGGVATEYDLVSKHGLCYLRLPIISEDIPSDDIVDVFVECLKDNLIKKNHLHFHCKKGTSKTDLFMIMYDMMSNAKNVSFQNILKRHALLGSEDLLGRIDSKKPYRANINDRIAFLNGFYKYSLENGYSFNTPWTKWISR